MTGLRGFELESGNTALVLIDVQNDFCAAGEEFVYYRRNPDDVVPIQRVVDRCIVPVLERSRNKDLFVLFIKASYKAGQFDIAEKFCIPGTKGWDFYKIRPNTNSPKEKLFEKRSPDCFDSRPDLEKWLSMNRVDSVLIAGFTTDQCVKISALSSSAKNFNTIVIGDGVSTARYKLGMHWKTLEFFRQHPDIKVINSKRLKF